MSARGQPRAAGPPAAARPYPAAGRRLTIERFGPAGQRDAEERDALTAEAERVLAFAAPAAAHEVRFAPLAQAPAGNS
jgi:hypothetical protein